MIKVFVSGCYDIIHAGHLQFFREARSLGDYLIVSFASNEVLWHHKLRTASLPEDHKRELLVSLSMVDEVVVGTDQTMGLDFESEFRRLRPDILAVTTDDHYEDIKRDLCRETGAEYRVVPKTPPRFEPISTSQIVARIQAPQTVPLRVDFAGGWLDVPRHAIAGEFVVNCAVSPTVSLHEWDYHQKSGLGGSGAWAILNGRQAVNAELDLGVGWQDPAVIHETGCCVWRSGPRPILDFKRNGDFLAGRMGILWTGHPHDTPGLADEQRNYQLIAESGRIARQGVLAADLQKLADGIRRYYQAQIDEGMVPLAEDSTALAWKYCGGGWGGYAMYLFSKPGDRDAWIESDPENRRAVEPFLRN